MSVILIQKMKHPSNFLLDKLHALLWLFSAPINVFQSVNLAF